MELEYNGIVDPHLVTYEFEPLPPSAGMPATFMIHEHTIKSKGMAKVTSIYLLEEIAGRSGMLRISYFTQVTSEEEARQKIDTISSLVMTVQSLDRKGNQPVGSLKQIMEKAKTMGGDDLDLSGVSEENESQADDGIESVKGDIEPTEAPAEIEEADNNP